MPDSSLPQILSTIDLWPVPHAACAVIHSGEVVASHGETDRVFRLASISKVITAWACLIAVEEGSVSLDDAVGPQGSTLRHCLAHAAGYGFDTSNPIMGVGKRRIYSNTGIETAARHITERTGMTFADYMNEAIFEPLGMTSALAKCDEAGNFVGSSYVYATARDFLKFGELYMNGGSVVVHGTRRQLLPDYWVNHARTVVANDPVTETQYGAHWWVWPQCENSLVATGYEGQYTVVIPEKQLVMVRLGKTDTSLRPAVMHQLQQIALKVTNL